MDFNITELKKHLGSGLGLRKNRYLIEIPDANGEQLNVLCQSAGLPERNINTTEVWHKGRRYSVRGETDFGGEYEVSIVDDDKMKLRQFFDAWLKKVDDSSRGAPSGGASYEGGGASVSFDYQTDINIWQTDRPRGGVKIYGYKLQNAYPKQVGIVTLDDGEENTLSEFSVTFAFSEFIPLTSGK